MLDRIDCDISDKAFECFDAGWFVFRAAVAVRPAAEPCQADRHDKIESSQSQVNTGFTLPKEGIVYLEGPSIERSGRRSR
jgi:hypothetical protein